MSEIEHRLAKAVGLQETTAGSGAGLRVVWLGSGGTPGRIKALCEAVAEEVLPYNHEPDCQQCERERREAIGRALERTINHEKDVPPVSRKEQDDV
jgi:hypothetical protein